MKNLANALTSEDNRRDLAEIILTDIESNIAMLLDDPDEFLALVGRATGETAALLALLLGIDAEELDAYLDESLNEVTELADLAEDE